MFLYKETALFLGLSFWLHQGRIPRCMCRFYLLLAGAVGKRQGIAIPYPSPTPLLTPFGDPLRRGILAAAVDRDFGFRYPVLLLLPSSEYCLAICVRLCIVRVSVGLLGLCRTFFIIGGGTVRSCGYVGFCYGLSLELPLTANGTSIWRMKGRKTESYRSILNMV